ncbi:hypothetical protein [Peribacillus simplex]|uniref:hypothetical protein n=1 Tax=Peribacillus simplex TaxID=1478 RepID=UPI001628DF6B|nr:hypothetical protein [Peribacillus simplex]
MENEYLARAVVNGTDTVVVMAVANGTDTVVVMAVANGTDTVVVMAAVIGTDTVVVMAAVIGNTDNGFHAVGEYGLPDLVGLGFVGGEKKTAYGCLFFCFFFVLSNNSNYQYACFPTSPSEVQITANKKTLHIDIDLNPFRQLVVIPDFNKIIRTIRTYLLMSFKRISLFYPSLISYREDKQTIPYCSYTEST